MSPSLAVGSRRYVMAKNNYNPVSHDHAAFLERALERKGFGEAYAGLEDEYRLVRELLGARLEAGLTQEEVAACMGTTKSAVSRLEAAGKHSPSVATLTKYAKAVGCEVEIKLVPTTRKKGHTRARKSLYAD
jgi:DNA-binding XRE family transcriptional regulator